MLKLVILILTTLLCGICALQPQVKIDSGVIQGYYDKSFNGNKYAAFEGIPYAKQPVGEYRFREPQQLKPWKGVWIANQTTQCIQYDHMSPKAEGYAIVGQEDCLTVNVYTPDLSQTALLNVVVHIHGGAFIFGAGHLYGPKHLMDANVVYVNFNYRVGPLGFLSTEDEVVPGNNGLKDQSFALKWIKKNVQYFGGNPDKILLTGLSAGGASVTFHLISPMSAGLFNSAIALSGSALTAWAMAEKSLEKAKIVAEAVGCSSISNKDMIECMKHRPATQIVQTVELFMHFRYNPFSPFGAVVEKAGPNPFLSDSPYNLLKASKVNDVPLILSVVTEEGLYPAAEFQATSTLLPELEKRWHELAPYVLDYYHTVPREQHGKLAEIVKKEYLSDRPISEATFDNLVQMIGDRMFVEPLELSVKLFANAKKTPTYFIYFKYRGEFSYSQFLSQKTDNFGVCHADDLLYIFSNPMMQISNESDLKMKSLLLNLWINFLNTGKVSLPQVVTKPVSGASDIIDFIQIDSPTLISMESAKTLSNRQFWNSLPFAENEKAVYVKDEL